MKINKRRWLLIIALHLWWLLLSGKFLWSYWTNGTIGGADGSGHVAALHLYATYVYPDIQGWLPEFFGGMPFPVYYPPLFYWLGATLMKLSGIDANLAAKILTTASVAALPGALFGLARRLGLSEVEAAMGSAWAGVIACGSNLASLGGVGLLGLFEVGLYTHTLGFAFFSVWCGALPHARRSRTTMALAIVSLTAVILTNVHVLPLAAAYTISWLSFDYWRRRSRPGRQGQAKPIAGTIQSALLVIIPLLIASIWLLPLVYWYTYSVGRPLDAPVLFSELGVINIVWPICIWVAWSERRRRPALASLCVALLLAAVAALTPLGGMLKVIPFQPARVLSGVILLCTIPGAFLISQTVRDLIGKGWLYKSVLASCVIMLALVHPWQRFGIASLSPSEDEALGNVRRAVKALPPGMVLVEIVRPNAIFNSSGREIRELATSRALAHQIAMDHRPIMWSIFREQAITAPLATAVTNLFSTSQENFEIDGTALSRAASMQVTSENALKLASHLGVDYYLVNSPEQFERLQNTPTVSLLWEVEGWFLFKNLLQPSAAIESVGATPVVGWMSPHFKNRSPDDIDLFNLWEELACDGRPEISLLWAQSPGTDPWNLTASLPSTIAVFDAATIRSANDRWLASLNAASPKLKVLLIDDGSPLAGQIKARAQNYAAYQRLNPQDYPSRKDLLQALAEWIAAWQPASVQQPARDSLRLWRTNAAYFPAWTTTEGKGVFLTGQGGMAVISSAEPFLKWHSLGVRVAALFLCLLGIAAAVWNIYSGHEERPTPSASDAT